MSEGHEVWRLIAVPFILLIPGHLASQAFRRRGETGAMETLGEQLFRAALEGALLTGWLALILAQLGLFSLGSLLLALGICSLACLACLLRRGVDLIAPFRQIQVGWEEGAVALLLGLSLLLYARPAEHLPVFLDPGWYVNTGLHVARTGSLTGESTLFSALPPSARSLFFQSFRSFRATMPQFPDVASSGFYLMAFAVSDVERGQIVPYHPPLFSVWIATFHALGGLRAALYATPLFGALAVLTLYFAGRALFGRGVGLLAALLLALSFTQLTFSRTPYAEVFTQFLLLGGVYALTTYTRGRRPSLALIAGLAFGQALLAKIESLIVLVPLTLFWSCWLWRKRGSWRDLLLFALPFGLLLAHALLLALTVNRPYVILNGHGLWLRFRSLLTGPRIWLGMGLSLALAAGGVWGGIRSRRKRITLSSEQRRWLKLFCAFLILLLAAYATFLQPLAAPGRTLALPQLGLFLSPLGVWLGVLGLVKLVVEGLERRRLFFLAFAVTFSLIVLAAPTVTTSLSRVYAIRRQVPAVIPSFLLLASYGLLGWPCGIRRGKRRKGAKRDGIPQGWGERGTLSIAVNARPATAGRVARSRREQIRHGRLASIHTLRVLLGRRYEPLVGLGTRMDALPRLAQGTTIAILLISFLRLDWPFLGYREMAGAVAFAQRLADHFDQGDIVLFEAIDADSHVGRFAAPLWTLYDKNALLLSTDDPPREELSGVLDGWLEEGREVYLVSQSRPPPLPLDHDLVPLAEERWRSSTLAPNLNFPPEIWEFEMPFHIYQIIQ